MKKVLSFLKKEPTLCAAAVLAAGSMFAVPPSAAYWGYIDFRVLGLLFCLMAVVAGFQSCGFFQLLAQDILGKCGSCRTLRVLLVALPFFCSMLVTNDVSLIAFVPFAILALNTLGQRRDIIRVVVLQTVAANLGSMATPVGNPQNLYLYARYQLDAGAFFSTLLPLVAVSFVLLMAAAAWGEARRAEVHFDQPARLTHRGHFAVYLALFGACLLCVFRVLPYQPLTAAVFLVMLVLSPEILKKVDYGLLLTFVFFFIFSGNLGRLTSIHALLADLLERNTLLASAAVSQVISNVPAAVLLSGLTENWKGLLLGVDVGGLGTPVASLASLISLKLYMATPGHTLGRYLLFFAAANILGLLLLLPLAALL